MSTITQSPSSNKPNPDWNNQVKIGRGRTDTGAFHRALVVANKLFQTGKWNGRGLLVIHDAYNTHLNMDMWGQEPQLGRDYEFADDSIYRGAGPDEPEEEVEAMHCIDILLSQPPGPLAWPLEEVLEFEREVGCEPMETRLVYVPSQGFDGQTFWRLYTTDGIRFTPDVLTTEELVAKERSIRNVEHPGLPLSFQYF